MERLSSALRERDLELETTSAALYNLQNVLAQFQVLLSYSYMIAVNHFLQTQREMDIKSECQVIITPFKRSGRYLLLYIVITR